MIKHVLVPLDGSVLAEYVLPHVTVIAQAFNPRITLLHILLFRMKKASWAHFHNTQRNTFFPLEHPQAF